MSIQRFRRLSAPARVAAAATAAAVVVWSAVWITPDSEDASRSQDLPSEAEPSAQAPAPTQPSAEAVQPVRERPAPQTSADARRPPAQPAPEKAAVAPATLRDALASDNAGTRIEAVRKLGEQRKVEALPDLLALDVTRDPELAPTLIQVAAQLAQRADSSQRAAAATQLSSWLRSESARESADARGNVSVLVETLAGIHAPEAEAALIEVLQNGQQPLHVQTLAVEGLAKLGTPAAQAALTQFRAQLSQTERQGFELELQREAEQATDRALAQLSKSK